MEEKTDSKKGCKIKDFFKGLVEKMDKKMQEKAKDGGCCCKKDKEDKSCCG